MKPFDGSSKQNAGRGDFGAGRVPDELIDAILDGDVDRADSKELFETLGSNPDAAGDLNATRRAIGALREPVQGPDFADRVLDTVGQKRGGWLSGRDRRWVIGGRVAAAAAVLLVVGGLYMAERAKPGTLDVSNQPRAVAGLANSVSDQSTRLTQQTQRSVATLGDSAFGVVQLLTRDGGVRQDAPSGLGMSGAREGGTARVIFEWPMGDGEGLTEPPRMLVFSDQPISAASLAEHLSSITRQAGEAERSLRAGETLERLMDRLPRKVMDHALISTLSELASGGFQRVSNSPAGGSGGLGRIETPGSMPVLITLPGFDGADRDDGTDPE